MKRKSYIFFINILFILVIMTICHWLQVLRDVDLLQVPQLEGLPVLLPHILRHCQAVKVVD